MQSPLSIKRMYWATTPSFFTQRHTHSSPFTSLLLTTHKKLFSNTKNKARKSNYYKSNKSAMPCSSTTTVTGGSGGSGGGDNNGSLRNFKLNESTFLASLMPKKEIGADRFIENNPRFDGRGTIIAIFGTQKLESLLICYLN